MPEKRIQGVNVDVTGQKKMERDYTQSDVQVVLRRGRWHDWGEMIHWLETEGEKDNELTPGETIAMTEDLRMVHDGGDQFTNDPQRVYQLMHQHRGPQRKTEPHVEAERREEAKPSEEAKPREEAEPHEEAEPREESLYSEKGILRRGGYIWR